MPVRVRPPADDGELVRELASRSRAVDGVSDRVSTVASMVVLSNRHLGPAAELLVSDDVASAILRATAEAARPRAQSRWEHELVLWLEDRARHPGPELDVGELAWTPEHFEHQRQFVTDAIGRAALGSEHARALGLWARIVGAHPRAGVVVGRRWRWTRQAASA